MRRSGGMRATCQNPFRRRFVISSQMVFVMLSLRLIPYSLLCPLDEPLG